MLACVGLAGLFATTLERMSIEEMAQQSTEIVRARVTSQRAEQRNGVIYTRSVLTVLDRWKGTPAATVEVSVPGGKLGNLQQSFPGAPALGQGAEYVFFLWTGKSGVTQVIGLSQGVFSYTVDAKGQGQVGRAAAAASMLENGKPVADSSVAMSLSQLDQAIRKALSTASSGKAAAQ